MEVKEPSAKYLVERSRDSEFALEDWRLESLGEISSIERGKFSARPRNDPRLYGGATPFLQTGDVAHSRGRIRNYSQTLNASGLLVSRLFPKGTLFFTIAANIGDVGIASFSAACPDSLVAITPRDGVSVEWLLHELASRKGDFEKLASPGAQLNINLEKLRPYVLAVPPATEQHAIAEALTDADALIESLEQLLTKKRQIKQGAMQELLTGKRRLPGFSDAWISCLWGDVIDNCSSGATPLRSHPEYYRGAIRWISSGELNFNFIEETLEHISAEALEKTNLKIHPAGTFLMAITGLEAAGTRGACGIVGKPAATNQSCMAIYPSSKLLTAYLFHYYVYKGDELALRYCQGTKQQSYTAALIRLLPIEYPESTDEQLAIAQVLSDIDAEITALESRLAKALSLKQAMAQALLTGRIRLVEPNV